MSNFARCKDGTWVNLDLVAKIVPVGEGPICAYRFFGLSGEMAGESEYGFDPCDAATVMPPLPGEAMFEFYAKSTERMPVSDEDIVMIETPILGWRCSIPRAKPVTSRPYLDRGVSMYLYRLSAGRFIDDFNKEVRLETLPAARAYVRDRLQLHFQ